MQKQHSNVLNDCMDSENDSSCDPRISESTSLSGGRVVHSNKKQKAKRKNSNVFTLRKRKLSENEALVNMTKNSRSNTEKSIVQQTMDCQSVLNLMHFYCHLKTHQLTVAIFRQCSFTTNP